VSRRLGLALPGEDALLVAHDPGERLQSIETGRLKSGNRTVKIRKPDG
jgi:hypothetical protein